MIRRLTIVGAGGLAREIVAAVPTGAVAGFLDDDPALHGTTVSGLPVLGPIADAMAVGTDLVIGVGAGRARRRIANALADMGVGPDRFTTVVHSHASVPASCTIGRGSVLLAGAVLTADVILGDHVVLMPNAVVTHDDVVEDFATLCAGVSLGGGVRIGAGAYLGMNVSVRENVTVGSDAVIGMGSAVLRDVPNGRTWVGVPAAPIHERVLQGDSR